jgi:hypothetical protein
LSELGGYGDATEALKLVEKRMTQKQIDEASIMATTCLVSNYKTC